MNYCRRLVEIYTTAADELADRPAYLRVEFDQIQSNAPAMLEQIAKFCDLRFTTAQLSAAASTIRPPGVRTTIA
jgi:hypothetical protein